MSEHATGLDYIRAARRTQGCCANDAPCVYCSALKAGADALRECDRLRADLAHLREEAGPESCAALVVERDRLKADLAAAKQREGDARRVAYRFVYGKNMDNIEVLDCARRILAIAEHAPAQTFHSCARSTGMEQVDDDIRDDPAQHPDDPEPAPAQPTCPYCDCTGPDDTTWIPCPNGCKGGAR